MISYAQNFEDVMLARAFAGRADGFYIDIGACFPDAGSVTKHFYDLGWTGINVEPMPEPFQRLVAERSRDVNLDVAIADHAGELRIFLGDTPGESTAMPRDPSRPSRTVRCITLGELCRSHVRRPIDFLKIDVEGLECAVIAGGDWTAYRPAIVVCEVVHPWSNTRREDYAEIVAQLNRRDYDEVYFDGLNSFFVAREAGNLHSAFTCPPNVLDDFLTLREVRLAERVTSAEAHGRKVEARLREVDNYHLDAARKLTLEHGRALDAAARERDEARAGWAAAIEQLEAVSVDRATAQSSPAEAQKELRALHGQLDESRQQLDAARQQLDESRQKVDETARLLHEAKEARDDLQARLTATLDDARTMEEQSRARSAALSTQILEKEAAVHRLQQALAAEQERLARDLNRRDVHLAQLTESLRDAQSHGAHTEILLRSIEASRSWRMTRPLREIRAALFPRPHESEQRRRSSPADRISRHSASRATRITWQVITTCKGLPMYGLIARMLKSRYPEGWQKLKRALPPRPIVASPQGGGDAVPEPTLLHSMTSSYGPAESTAAAPPYTASQAKNVEEIEALLRHEIARHRTTRR